MPAQIVSQADSAIESEIVSLLGKAQLAGIPGLVVAFMDTAGNIRSYTYGANSACEAAGATLNHSLELRREMRLVSGMRQAVKADTNGLPVQ